MHHFHLIQLIKVYRVPLEVIETVFNGGRERLNAIARVESISNAGVIELDGEEIPRHASTEYQ